jgi:Zn finger protein HypA/HybF involved in hydrogenase expression
MPTAKCPDCGQKEAFETTDTPPYYCEDCGGRNELDADIGSLKGVKTKTDKI